MSKHRRSRGAQKESAENAGNSEEKKAANEVIGESKVSAKSESPSKRGRRSAPKPKIFEFLKTALDTNEKRSREGMKKRWSAGANLEQRKKTTETRKKTATRKRTEPKGKTAESVNINRNLHFLPAGTEIVNSETQTAFVVKRMLRVGTRTHGDVYLMEDDQKREYAMKTERSEEGVKELLCKEIFFYQQMQGERSKRFLQLFDSGQTVEFRFTITDPIVCFLEQIVTSRRIDSKTAIRFSMQTLKALEDLHSCGFVHRDVKPANFAIQFDGSRNRIVFFELQTCCPIPPSLALTKKPKFGFIGTQRYASRSAHRGMFHTAQCDVESWLYMSVDFFDLELLRWGGFENDKRKTCEAKENFFKEPQALATLPSQFVAIVERIGESSYSETPNYHSFHVLLLAAATKLNIDPEASFELMAPKEVVDVMEAAIPEETCIGDEVETKLSKEKEFDGVCNNRKMKSIEEAKNKSAENQHTPLVEIPKRDDSVNEENLLAEQSMIDFEEDADDS